MLADLQLPSLQDRRKTNQLIVFLYNMVKGQVPMLQSHDFLTPVWGKRLIKSKHYKDCVTSNIIDRQSTNNSKCFKPVQCTLGPVVQSVISLTSSLRVISLTVLADSIYNILIFFAEKM